MKRPFRFKIEKLNKMDMTTRLLLGAGTIAAVFAVFFAVFWFSDSDSGWIVNRNGSGEVVVSDPSPITGQSCANRTRRPAIVMLAGDPEARPLAGLNQADIIFEMPVTPNGINRFMAVFQCEEPEEIGSIRSAREDFLPLASVFNPIYAHWGGEHHALELLNSGVLDNVNALIYDGTVFYRKNSVKPPHNGFTTIANLFDIAGRLGYSEENTFAGFPHSSKKPERSLSNMVSSFDINYPAPFNVNWQYDEASNTYKRSRGEEPEIDANTGQQINPSVVVVMKTTSTPIDWQYIRVQTKGKGEAEFYQNGIRIAGTWENDGENLKFRDQSGEEIEFAPGRIWISITVH